MPLQEKIEKEILRKKKWGEFVLPFYEKYCYSNIPDAIRNILTSERSGAQSAIPQKLFKEAADNSEKVVMFLVDGFGYYQWKRYYQKLDFFRSLTNKGKVVPLTTIFPSTTAATLTTINSGMTPNQHGLPEWTVYFKEIDMVLNSLPFIPVVPKDRLAFAKKSDPKILFKGKTFYKSLSESKVKSFAFLSAEYAFSSYSDITYAGSTRIPFISLADLSVKLVRTLEKTKGPAYFYVYIGDIDHVAHVCGPHTEEYKIELESLDYILQKAFLEKVSRGTARETTVMATADHGQINVNPQKTVYLNKFGKLARNLAKSKKGKTIPPTGSPRDVFLHVKDGKIEEMKQFLQSKIGRLAKIIETEEALDMNLFGIGKATEKLRDRVGNLLILPYKNNLIWYEFYKGNKFELKGHHGGLTRDEMMIELAVAKLSDLI